MKKSCFGSFFYEVCFLEVKCSPALCFSHWLPTRLYKASDAAVSLTSSWSLLAEEVEMGRRSPVALLVTLWVSQLAMWATGHSKVNPRIITAPQGKSRAAVGCNLEMQQCLQRTTTPCAEYFLPMSCLLRRVGLFLFLLSLWGDFCLLFKGAKMPVISGRGSWLPWLLLVAFLDPSSCQVLSFIYSKNLSYKLDVLKAVKKPWSRHSNHFL